MLCWPEQPNKTGQQGSSLPDALRHDRQGSGAAGQRRTGTSNRPGSLSLVAQDWKPEKLQGGRGGETVG